MALSRMIRCSNLCPKSTILSRPTAPDTNFLPVRTFRKVKPRNDIVDTTKINTQSVATPFNNIAIETSNLKSTNLWKPFCFTVGFSIVSFTGCAIWEYETMRSHAYNMIRKPVKFFKKRAEFIPDRSGALVKEVKKWWNSLTPGEQVFAPICLINVLVFAAWRVPRLQPFMLRYFCSNPASEKVCLPMILSTFSHYSVFHLLANMYVLHSFSTGAVHSLGKEQFLGLYLSSGVISSFTSYLYKIVTKQPGLSLGASGAIMAILGYVCTQYPDTRLGIIFLPMLTFSAGAAIKFIIGMDTAGVLMRWRFFDHAAHLGGAACGIVWALWGSQYIWQKREPLLQYWHELRGSIK